MSKNRDNIQDAVKKRATDSPNGHVRLVTYFPETVFARMEKFSSEKGFMKVNDMVRVSLMTMLEKNGY